MCCAPRIWALMHQAWQAQQLCVCTITGGTNMQTKGIVVIVCSDLESHARHRSQNARAVGTTSGFDEGHQRSGPLSAVLACSNNHDVHITCTAAPALASHKEHGSPSCSGTCTLAGRLTQLSAPGQPAHTCSHHRQATFVTSINSACPHHAITLHSHTIISVTCKQCCADSTSIGLVLQKPTLCYPAIAH